MSKNKNDKNTNFDFEPIVSSIGLTAMSLAALAGLIEVHENRQHRYVNQLQPAYAVSTEPVNPPETGETMARREKDEIRHMTVSYGTMMRSHPVTGKL